MKIAITGHTNGLGKFLYSYFTSLGHEVIGFARSTGYDIETDIDKILEQSEGVDVFINNAYAGTYQSDITKKLLGKVKYIVVSGSESISLPNIKCASNDDYQNNKTIIADTCMLASMNSTDTNILHLKIPFMENSSFVEDLSTELTISFAEIAETINFWFQHPNINEVRFKWKLSEKIFNAFADKNQNNMDALNKLREQVTLVTHS